MPRNSVIQEAEALGMTVVQAFPDSDMAKLYRELATLLIKEEAV
jgi:nitrogenase iron protein NifH